MKLGLSHKGLLDVNKSLAINPYFFEAYLARAALFGQAGRYTKAILNCNEAIQISPSSVRAYLCRYVCGTGMGMFQITCHLLMLLLVVEVM